MYVILVCISTMYTSQWTYFYKLIFSVNKINILVFLYPAVILVEIIKKGDLNRTYRWMKL